MTALEYRSPVSIRRAQTTDGDALAHIYLDTAHHFVAIDPAGHQVPEPDAVRRRIEVKLADKAIVLFVADSTGEVVGLLELELVAPPPLGSLLRSAPAVRVGVAVREDRRGAGIGTALMRFAEQWATDHGRTMMILDTSAANSGASRLYERLGYETYGLLMRKPLAADPPAT